MTKEKAKILKDYVRHCWNAGDLYYKLKDYQVGLYNSIADSTEKKFVVNCSRRFGKSYILSLIAVEFALKNKNAHIRFAAPTQKQLREIVQPIFQKICADAPKELAPEYKTAFSHYYFPGTNSYIHVAGCDDNNAENLRGHDSDMNLLDEAGFMKELEYILNDILLPQTLTSGGRTIIASTPSKTPAHYFTRLCEAAKFKNSYAIYTIHDNTSIDNKTKNIYCEEAGGPTSTTWRREYLCEFVVDEELVIVPEWRRDFVGEIELDAYRGLYQNYVSMDVGGRHKTAVLFAYYNFKKTTLQIEDEAIFSGADTTSDLIARTVKAIEGTLWGGLGGPRRVADNNNVIFLQDMQLMHGLSFSPTSKDTLLAMVNELRIFVFQKKLVVHPRCKELIGCLDSAVWNTRRDAFDVSDLYGHYDALAALMYMVRNIDQYTNPVTVNNIGRDQYRSVMHAPQQGSRFEVLKKVFRRR